MLTYEVRPISDRTQFRGIHRTAAFKTAWSRTERLLLREIEHLAGTDVAMELDVTAADIRLDGRLRANAHPATPCVRVAFNSKHGPLVYATDRYTRWWDNARAIALGLEALRAVDRHGITRRGEQYQGWAQLPAGSGNAATFDHDQARDFLLSLMANPDSARHLLPLDQLIRRAKAKAHPDRNDGDRTLWDRVEQAARVLGVNS